jgi:hypothetical protein
VKVYAGRACPELWSSRGTRQRWLPQRRAASRTSFDRENAKHPTKVLYLYLESWHHTGQSRKPRCSDAGDCDNECRLAMSIQSTPGHAPTLCIFSVFSHLPAKLETKTLTQKITNLRPTDSASKGLSGWHLFPEIVPRTASGKPIGSGRQNQQNDGSNKREIVPRLHQKCMQACISPSCRELILIWSKTCRK